MQLKEKVTKIIKSLSDEDIYCLFKGDFTTDIFDNKNIKYTEVDHYGGEDQGKDYYTIYSFKDNYEVYYVKFYGNYDEFYGLEYTNYMFIQPKGHITNVYS